MENDIIQGGGFISAPLAKSLGVKNPFDPVENIKGCSRHLANLYQVYGKNFDPPLTEDEALKFVLAEYNGGNVALNEAGLKRVEIKGKPNHFGKIEYSEVEPYLTSETRNYVRDVIKAMKKMQK
jgi:membrane-bound lytic murein transglycosylase MltF